MRSVFGEILAYNGILPELHQTVFVASGSRIIGDVKVGEWSGIWYNCVIRGDVNFIRIGRYTNIQDGCILHITSGPSPLLVGDYVTVGHGAILHSCTIENSTLIGMGSILLDGAVVKENAMVAAGSLLRPGFVAPGGKLVGGVPAKVIRDLKIEEIEYFQKSAENYSEYALNSIKSLQS